MGNGLLVAFPGSGPPLDLRTGLSMHVDALKKLRCPACVGELRLQSFADQGSDGAVVVDSGVLLCERCRVAYPIESATPVMLRFSTAFHQWFASKHARELAEIGDYSLPSGMPRTGETAVQETFTDEWNLTEEDELSFSYTDEQLVDLNRHVWLRWLDEAPPDERPRSLLNVGCGAGAETKALREVTGADEIFALDLNFSLLSRRPEFHNMPGVTFIVASLFDLPFERDSFDFVYSQGVIHHTYSSSDAFSSIAARVRPGGKLFVWVYGLEDHLAPTGSTFWKRRHHLAEQMSRPLISRAPRPLRNLIFKLLTTVSHLRPRGGLARSQEKVHGKRWKRENTEHQLRDWLSPRYARRHGYNEVMEWFEEGGFRVIDTQSPKAYMELFKGPLFGIGMTGERRMGAEAKSSESVREQAHA
jgi:SAM-dependent methyltransferase